MEQFFESQARLDVRQSIMNHQYWTYWIQIYQSTTHFLWEWNSSWFFRQAVKYFEIFSANFKVYLTSLINYLFFRQMLVRETKILLNAILWNIVTRRKRNWLCSCGWLNMTNKAYRTIGPFPNWRLRHRMSSVIDDSLFTKVIPCTKKNEARRE